MPRPTIKTIAHLAGCSIATVSKALHNSPVVRPEKRLKIHRIAADIGYAADVNGIKLRTGRTFQIAIIMTTALSDRSEWEGVGYDHILSGISEVLAGTRYKISVLPIPDFAGSVEAIRQIVRYKLADGVIFSGTTPLDERVAFLMAEDFPFVTYGQTDHKKPHPFVDMDSEGAAYGAAKRLTARGHRRIALINPPEELMYAQQRLRGYRRALREGKIAFDRRRVASGRLTAALGRAALLDMAKGADMPTAYICANEATALGVLSGMRERGLVFGRDAVVIATDDLNVSGYFDPPLTTFYLPIEETSRRLGEFVLRRIEGEAPEKLQQTFMPQLVERQSDRLTRESPRRSS
jgi:LacI family transcriptional regulator